ncbi:MAG: 16S rRNA pseudouridine(516) synthase [Clostridia bacterium]|nr:16S rRNA pseudouridine(516) synthase [Clostridia bacterium]
MIQRIDKIISSQMNVSRNDARSMIKSGSVAVDGKSVTDSSAKVDAENSEITVNGKPLFFKEHIYIMMNKPQGVVSATTDNKIKTVIDIVPEALKRKNLFPAGRLDRDTVGFMLITDDGDFAHRILSPLKHVPKTYIANLRDRLSEEARQTLENGAVLSDGTQCMDALVRVIDEEGKVAEITIREGKYHQIKRMFASVGNEVTFLKRISIGNLHLDESLEEGECREITENELSLIEKR